MLCWKSLNDFLGKRLSHLLLFYLFLAFLFIRVFFLEGVYIFYLMDFRIDVVEFCFMFLDINLYLMIWIILFQWWEGLKWLMMFYVYVFSFYLLLRGWIDFLGIEYHSSSLGLISYELIRKYSDFELYLFAYECKAYGVLGEQYFYDLVHYGTLEKVIKVCDGSKEVLVWKLRLGYNMYSSGMFLIDLGLTGCAIFLGAYIGFVWLPFYF